MSLAVDRRSHSRARPLIVLLLLIALTLTILDRTSTGPVDFATDYVRDGLGSIGDLWPGVGSSQVEQDNEELRAQLEQARNQLAQSADAVRERENLARMLVLATPDSTPKVVARVVAVGADNFESSIEIGKGTDAGVAVGMPVVANDGLIGRVIETSQARSIVLLLTDTTSGVGVRFVSTGEVGVATGDGSGNEPRVDLIDLNSAIGPGDIAVTSGQQNSLFPPGIPVGIVGSSDAGPQDLRRTVKLTPSVDMSRLDTVAVLQWNARQDNR